MGVKVLSLKQLRASLQAHTAAAAAATAITSTASDGANGYEGDNSGSADNGGGRADDSGAADGSRHGGGGCPYDLLVLSRRDAFKASYGLLAEHCSNAPIVFDTVDLHFLREAREAR